MEKIYDFKMNSVHSFIAYWNLLQQEFVFLFYLTPEMARPALSRPRDEKCDDAHFPGRWNICPITDSV